MLKNVNYGLQLLLDKLTINKLKTKQISQICRDSSSNKNSKRNNLFFSNFYNQRLQTLQEKKVYSNSLIVKRLKVCNIYIKITKNF